MQVLIASTVGVVDSDGFKWRAMRGLLEVYWRANGGQTEGKRRANGGQMGVLIEVLEVVEVVKRS
jgi:hypothetical protein